MRRKDMMEDRINKMIMTHDKICIHDRRDKRRKDETSEKAGISAICCLKSRVLFVPTGYKPTPRNCVFFENVRNGLCYGTDGLGRGQAMIMLFELANTVDNPTILISLSCLLISSLSSSFLLILISFSCVLIFSHLLSSLLISSCLFSSLLIAI